MSHPRRLAAIALLAVMVATSVVLGAPAVPRRGGTINVAIIGEPPSLDPHWTTQELTARIAMNIFEPLFTFDARYNVVPMLAESHTVSPDGKRYVVKLRRNVKFHDGSAMTSADVLASLQRWSKLDFAGRSLFAGLVEMTAPDAYTVVFDFKTRTGLLLTFLAKPLQNAAILPKAIAEAAGQNQLQDSQLIGTGPYRFVEWRHDQLVRLRRFDEYSKRNDAPTGYGGAKNAYLDEIVFQVVKDATVRLAGLKTGQYQFAQQVSVDDFDDIKRNPNLVAIIGTGAPRFPGPIFNLAKPGGLTTNVKIRRAIGAALDAEPLLKATAKRREFYALNGSIYPRGNRWYTTAGTQNYNPADPELTRKLMSEAGYKGQPLKVLVQTDIQQDYQYILVALQQLRDAGFNLNVQYTDYTTITSLRTKPQLPDAYDLWWAGGFIFQPEPSLQIWLSCDFPAAGMGWCDKDVQALAAQLREEPDFSRRYAIWERIQRVYWERVPFVKLGDFYLLDAIRSEVKGYVVMDAFFFWNVWLER